MQKQVKGIFQCFLRYFFWLVVLANAALIFYKSLEYYPADFSTGFLSDKEDIFYPTVYHYFFYGHISISSVILVLGLFQFSKKFRAKYTPTHRLMGKVYISLVLFISAPSAFIMGVYATGSLLIKGGFVVASVLWWWFTYKAYLCIKAGNTDAHSRFMHRSYIISLLAVFLRVYYWLLVSVFAVDNPNVYTFVVYASWLPNLLGYELWLVWRRQKNKSLSTA